MKFKVNVQFVSQRINGWFCLFWRERQKGRWGKTRQRNITKKTNNKSGSVRMWWWKVAHTGSLKEWIKPLQLGFLTVHIKNHSTTPVLLGCCQSLGHSPLLCVGAWESVIPVSFKTKVGHWCVLLRGPRLPWWWRVEPGGISSVIQDDLDKAGHVRLFGVMQGEKRMLLKTNIETCSWNKQTKIFKWWLCLHIIAWVV